ncbi:lactate racemase domain-containing protein [Thermotoga profunda]|uniref:lactate racemase domain-containing protein n=1 Tax=Thermotoga profunda TaxID=1508420 RepID=UPI000597BE2D|nr:lactate racemase domain-containing protein [Thermotoga profunda]
MSFIENLSGELSSKELSELIERVLPDEKLEKVLLIHPDYTRQDFSDRLVPLVYEHLKKRGLKILHTLNASGTHRAMSEKEVRKKLGLYKEELVFFNHEYANPNALTTVGILSKEFVSEKTMGDLEEPLPVTLNKLFFEKYDLIIVLSGTSPHESTGFSGGLKSIIPGIAGPDVVGLFHWAAVLIGIPRIIGSENNPAREVINEACKIAFEKVNSPVLFLNMVYEETDNGILAKGLYTGFDLEGSLKAYKQAVKASQRIHIIYLDKPVKIAVQVIGENYDEIWTAGKGSYKLQRPGVLVSNGEIIIYAPHIEIFHSNPQMDRSIREIGYHCKDYVKEFLKKHPKFDLNVASHVINVRGDGTYDPILKKEEFAFTVTLATSIPKEECEAVGLAYRDPRSIRKEDFQSDDCLWIEHGGKFLYDLKREA